MIKRRNSEVAEIIADVLSLGGFFAGGYVRWEVTEDDKDYTDIDIFCKTSLAFDRLVDFMIERYGVVSKTTPFALTWENVAEGRCIQLIKTDYDSFGRKLYGEPEDIIRDFDFTVIAIATTSVNTYGYHRDFLLDNALNRLTWLRQPNAGECLANFYRLMKYARKGFAVPVPTLVALSKVISEAGLEKYDVTDMDTIGDSGK